MTGWEKRRPARRGSGCALAAGEGKGGGMRSQVDSSEEQEEVEGAGGRWEVKGSRW